MLQTSMVPERPDPPLQANLLQQVDVNSLHEIIIYSPEARCLVEIA